MKSTFQRKLGISWKAFPSNSSTEAGECDITAGFGTKRDILEFYLQHACEMLSNQIVFSSLNADEVDRIAISFSKERKVDALL